MRKYVFLDRDGVINKDGAGVTETGYILNWEDFKFPEGCLEGIKMLTEAGYDIVIISNQKCVAKGLITLEELDELSVKMVQAIVKAGGDVLEIYYCPHSEADECDCRKPKSGLFFKAQKELDIDTLEGSYFVGDTERDIIAGKNAGLKTALVLTGKSSDLDAEGWEVKPDVVCKDLAEFAEKLITEEG